MRLIFAALITAVAVPASAQTFNLPPGNIPTAVAPTTQIQGAVGSAIGSVGKAATSVLPFGVVGGTNVIKFAGQADNFLLGPNGVTPLN
jgi:hypothetical protein